MQVVGNLSAMLTAAQGRWLSFEHACGKVGCGGSQPLVFAGVVGGCVTEGARSLRLPKAVDLSLS
jgi:hypothetical protein